MSPKLHLDTDAIIRFIESPETDAGMLFENSAVGLPDLYSSQSTLAEALVGPNRIGGDTPAAEYEAFFWSDDRGRASRHIGADVSNGVST